jgi:hypothetical protein
MIRHHLFGKAPPAKISSRLQAHGTAVLSKPCFSENFPIYLLWGEPGVTHNPDKPPLACVNKLEDSFNQ